MPTIEPDWTAPRVGQNWRDDELMLAVAWLKSFVPRRDMDRRIDAAKAYLAAARCVHGFDCVQPAQSPCTNQILEYARHGTGNLQA